MNLIVAQLSPNDVNQTKYGLIKVVNVRKNAIEMYAPHNEEKSVIAERFIRTLKNKTYKYMT